MLETLPGGTLRVDQTLVWRLEDVENCEVRQEVEVGRADVRLGVDYAYHGFHIALYMEGASSVQKRYPCSTATGS